MEYSVLGRTGLRVSSVGLGCWPIGGPFYNLGLPGGWRTAREDDVRESLLYAVEHGINCFDTADVYGLGNSERHLGRMVNKLKSHSAQSRSSLCIVSKVGYFAGNASHGFDPLHMRHQAETTLKNLNTDYLDVYLFHHLDFGPDNIYLDDAMEAMYSLKRAGAVRFIGMRGPHRYSGSDASDADSRLDKWQHFKDLASVVEPDVIGVRYNMLSQSFDTPSKDIFAWAGQQDIGVLIYKPLGQGLLLDKYDPDNPPVFPPGDHRSRKLWFENHGLSILREVLKQVKHRFGCVDTADLARLAISYCRSRHEHSCTLVGFRTLDQVKDNLQLRDKLNDEDREWLRQAFSRAVLEAGPFTTNI